MSMCLASAVSLRYSELFVKNRQIYCST